MKMCICSTDRCLASSGLKRCCLYFIRMTGCFSPALLSPAAKFASCGEAESISVLEMCEQNGPL